MGQSASISPKPALLNTAPVAPVAPVNSSSSMPSAGLNFKPSGGRRHRKRRGGVAPLSAFNAPQHQPSQRIMNWATTAGGSRRKHKSRKHKSRRHRK
jgi:hypothetical protein